MRLAVLILCALLAVAARATGERDDSGSGLEQDFKEFGLRVGKAAKEGAIEIGHAARDAAKKLNLFGSARADDEGGSGGDTGAKIKKDFKEFGVKFGKAVKDGAVEFGHATRDTVHSIKNKISADTHKAKSSSRKDKSASED